MSIYILSVPIYKIHTCPYTWSVLKTCVCPYLCNTVLNQYMKTGMHLQYSKILLGIFIIAPIIRSTTWAFIRKEIPFILIIEITTLLSFSSKTQINAQGIVTENPGTSGYSLMRG